MTVVEAQKRYPLVPLKIIKWAIENIHDERDLERGLNRLEQAKRIQLKYAN